MAISFVQTAALGANANLAALGTLQTVAFGAQPTVGNYIVTWSWGFSGSHATSKIPSFSDTGGNTYVIPTNAHQPRTNDLWVLVGYTKVVTAGASFKVTVTMPSATWGTGSVDVVAAEFSGIAASSPLDGATAVGTTNTTGVPAPGNLALTSGSLVVAGMVRNTSSFLGSTPTGFTRVGFQNDGSGNEVGEAIYAINPASPSNPAWTTSTTGWGVAQFALLLQAAAPAFFDLAPASATRPRATPTVMIPG